MRPSYQFLKLFLGAPAGAYLRLSITRALSLFSNRPAGCRKMMQSLAAGQRLKSDPNQAQLSFSPEGRNEKPMRTLFLLI